MPNPEFVSSTPAAPLDAAVEMILFVKGNVPGEMETILPHGKVALGLNLGARHTLGKRVERRRNASFSESWFSGLQTTPLYHHSPATIHVHGVLFDPLAFSEIFPQDMATWRDATGDGMDAVGTRFGRRLLTLCRESEDAGEIHQAIERQLLKKFEARRRHPPWLWHGYRQICQKQGRLKLEHLYREVEISGRRFTELFQIASGVSPKALCRVLRLHCVLTALDPGHEVNWSNLAHDADYSDQSHFNRDFKQFTGMTPQRYLENRLKGYADLQPCQDVSFVPEVE